MINILMPTGKRLHSVHCTLYNKNNNHIRSRRIYCLPKSSYQRRTLLCLQQGNIIIIITPLSHPMVYKSRLKILLDVYIFMFICLDFECTIVI